MMKNRRCVGQRRRLGAQLVVPGRHRFLVDRRSIEEELAEGAGAVASTLGGAASQVQRPGEAGIDGAGTVAAAVPP
jgi:hypothetical protein